MTYFYFPRKAFHFSREGFYFRVRHSNLNVGCLFRASEVAKLEVFYSDGKGFPYKLARIYAALGHSDIAFEQLEQAYDAHEFELVAMNVDPRLDSIREDSRFENLRTRIGLPIPRPITY